MMSITVSRCEVCYKMIGWMKAGDLGITIKILKDFKQCSTCYHVSNTMEVIDLCSIECFKEWLKQREGGE